MARNRADAVVREQRLHRLASKQEGRVNRRQLLERGFTPEEIRSRLATGRLIRERAGVYALPGAPAGSRARCAVALLEVGTGFHVSDLSAAADWRMTEVAPRVVDVTGPRRLRRRGGSRVHCRDVHPSQVVRPRGLPIASAAQTIFDLTTTLGLDSLAKVANQGFVERVLTIEALREVGRLNAGRKGARAFRRLLDRLDPQGRRVRSPLEVRVSDFLRARDLPDWEQNVRIRIGDDVVEPDFLWRSQRVYVEADGRDPHLAPLTFDADRRKDRRARVEGWMPVRVTWADLDRLDELERDLRALLGC